MKKEALIELIKDTVKDTVSTTIKEMVENNNDEEIVIEEGEEQPKEVEKPNVEENEDLVKAQEEIAKLKEENDKWASLFNSKQPQVEKKTKLKISDVLNS